MSRDSSLDEFLSTGDEGDDPEEAADPEVEREDGTTSDPTASGNEDPIDDDGNEDPIDDGNEDPVDDDGESHPIDGGEPQAEESSSTDPATATFVYSPGGGECDACGERVARRWQDGDRVVCSGCKEW